MPKLSKALIPFNRMMARQPLQNINKAVTNDSIIYDNIDKYYQRYSKYKKYAGLRINECIYLQSGVS